MNENGQVRCLIRSILANLLSSEIENNETRFEPPPPQVEPQIAPPAVLPQQSLDKSQQALP